MVPLPRLPINTGRARKQRGGTIFEKERNEPGGNFLGEQREASCRNEKKRGNKRGQNF
jgi:hypothetical protein